MSLEREERVGLTKLRQTYERMNEAAIRQTVSGWRFYDNQGRSFELSPTEGAELHKAGQTRVDELIRSLDGNSWLILIPAALTMMLGMRMASEFEAVGAMPTALYFMPCLLFFFKDVIAEIEFALSMMKWREAQADIFRQRDGREHEKHSYSVVFDPRLMLWVTSAMAVLGLIGLLVLAGIPPIATVLVGLGLGLVGIAQFGPARDDTTK